MMTAVSADPSPRRKVKPGAISLDVPQAVLTIDIETQLLDAADVVISRASSQKRVDLTPFLQATDLAAAAAELVANCKYIHKSKVAFVQTLLQQLQQSRSSNSQDLTVARTPIGTMDAIKPAVPRQAPIEVLPTKPETPKNLPETLQRQPVFAKHPSAQLKRDDDISEDDGDEEPIGAVVIPEQEAPSPVVRSGRRKVPPDRMRRKAASDRLRRSAATKPKASIDQLDEYLELLYEDDVDEIVRGTELLLQLAQSRDHLEVLCGNTTAIGALTRVLNDNWRKHADLLVNILDLFSAVSQYSALHCILVGSKIGDTTMKIIELECERYRIHREASADGAPSSRILQRQLKILQIAFTILMNLAEDVQIEVKLVSTGIARYLLSALMLQGAASSRSLIHLQVLVLTFLKKLSIIKENVAELAKLGIVTTLQDLAEGALAPDPTTAALRLLVNISFSGTIRDALAKSAPILALAATGVRSDDDVARQAAIRFLLNMTVDAKGRAVVAADTALVAQITDRILRAQTRQVAIDLIALAINLSTIESAAAVMGGKEVLAAMVKRAQTKIDPLLLKFLHNLAVHPGKAKEYLSRYVQDFMVLAKRSQRNEFLIEVLGVLGNLDAPGTTFSRALLATDFVEFLVKHLVPGFTDDDIVLAVVVVIGAAASDPKAAPFMANTRLIRLLADTLSEKCDDEEIVLQTVFAVFRLLLHQETRTMMLALPNLMQRLATLHACDENAQIRELAAKCVVIAMSHTSGDDRDAILDATFELHNFEWIQAVAHICTDCDRSRPRSDDEVEGHNH